MIWHPHDGTACPVPPTTKVAVQFRNGARCTEATEAGIWHWHWARSKRASVYYLDIVGFAEVAQRRRPGKYGDTWVGAVFDASGNFERFLSDAEYDAAFPSPDSANPPAPALDYEAQYQLASNTDAGAWGLVAVLRDMARRLDELDNLTALERFRQNASKLEDRFDD